MCAAIAVRLHVPQNIDYVRKVCNNLLLINGKDVVLSSNEALVAKAICDTTL